MGYRGHTNTWGYYCFYGKERKIVNSEQDSCNPQNNISECGNETSGSIKCGDFLNSFKTS